MAKRVFLSSVFRTLAKVRQAVHDQLVALGYEVWWAEDHPQLRTFPDDLVRAVCLQGIEASDVYLGVFPSRYGSDSLGLAFTELEYHHAVSLGLPRFLYILRSGHFVTDDQTIKQRGFLYFIKDRELSAIRPFRVSSLNELLTRISIDFEHPQSYNVPPWSAPCVERVRASSVTVTAPPTIPNLSISEATAYLRHISNQSFQEATVLGLAYIQRFFSDPDWFNPKFVKDLDEFLGAWNYVSSWAGVGGPLGPVNISKARIVLSQMLNDYSRVYDLAGAVASGLYADRRLHAARKWYELSQRFGRLPWLLGALELAEGNLKSARSCFREIIIQPALDMDNYGLHLGYYGHCLVKEGDQRNGLKHLDEAISLKGLRATTLTRLYRSLGEAYLHVGDIDSAMKSCERAASIARDNGLQGQVRKALRQWRQAASNNSFNPTAR